MDKKPPFRTKSGKLGCPICETVLMKDKASFHINEVYVGTFESWVCPICNYNALTEDGYEQAVIKAKQLAASMSEDLPEIDETKLILLKNDVEIKELIPHHSEEIESDPEWTEIIAPQIKTPSYTKSKLQ